MGYRGYSCRYSCGTLGKMCLIRCGVGLLWLLFRLSLRGCVLFIFFFFQAEDGIRDRNVTGVQTCALPIYLGRAPLAESAFDHIRETAGAYSNLEFDLESGERGKRDVHVGRLFQRLLSEQGRSEERRVGKECRSGRWAEQ